MIVSIPQNNHNTKLHDAFTILPTSYSFTKQQTLQIIVGYMSEFMLTQENSQTLVKLVNDGISFLAIQ